MDTDKHMWLIAGPPGAGKTTLGAQLFPSWLGTSRYIIADDLDSFDDGGVLPSESHLGVPVSKRLEVAELAGRSFAVETRLVAREPITQAIKLRRRGWMVSLIYLALPKIELCRERVRARIARGGDDVAPDVLEEAFNAALKNLPRHIDAAERWLILDGTGTRKTRIARGSYAAGLASEPQILDALLPGYPLITPSKSLRDDPWADDIETSFARLGRLQSTIDHMLHVADSMQSRERD